MSNLFCPDCGRQGPKCATHKSRNGLDLRSIAKLHRIRYDIFMPRFRRFLRGNMEWQAVIAKESERSKLARRKQIAAKKYGVSVNTISRYVRNDPRITPEQAAQMVAANKTDPKRHSNKAARAPLIVDPVARKFAILPRPEYRAQIG